MLLVFVCGVYPLPSRFFFFQAEDGIRDRDVTGVQTCALPIYCCAIPLCRHLRRSCSSGPTAPKRSCTLPARTAHFARRSWIVSCFTRGAHCTPPASS